jgi:hypothetical protein
MIDQAGESPPDRFRGDVIVDCARVVYSRRLMQNVSASQVNETLDVKDEAGVNPEAGGG